jgi:hypothetical protein
LSAVANFVEGIIRLRSSLMSITAKLKGADQRRLSRRFSLTIRTAEGRGFSGVRSFWCRLRISNTGPPHYEWDALSVELRRIPMRRGSYVQSGRTAIAETTNGDKGGE